MSPILRGLALAALPALAAATGCGTSETPLGSQGGAATVGELPCVISNAVVAKCQTCHGATPLYGAPMPLTTLADFHAAAKSDPTKQVFQLVALRIHSVDKPMPQPPSPPLAADEMANLDGWLQAGATAASAAAPSCAMINSGGSGTGVIGGGGAAGTLASGGGSGTTGSAGMMITGGGSGTTGTAGVGGDPGAAGTGAITLYPGAPEDCDAVYELHAHGQNGVSDTSKYSTSVNGNHYQCYYFKPPWGTDAVQGVQFASLVDNTKIVHHWILYGDDANSQNLIDGTISLGDCASGNNGNRYYITGWAPGGKDGNFPPDVGLQLPSSGMLTLEVHYLNDGSAQQDATGLKICVTHKPRANTAAIHWLGADANQQGTSLININASSAATVVGHCTPNKNQQIHVLSVSPHMHLTGVHQTTVLNHKSGGSVTLHDGPFDFHNQISYAVDPIAVMEPGDSITTTCSYQNTTPNKITYGEKTENEMCYNFVLAYPAGALSDGRKGCVPGYPCYPGGAKRCMDEGPP